MRTEFIQQTPSMFDAVPVAVVDTSRQTVIKAAFERADAAFLERYGLFD